MIKFLKSLFCKHQWQLIKLMQPCGIRHRYVRCFKCGKLRDINKFTPKEIKQMEDKQ